MPHPKHINDIVKTLSTVKSLSVIKSFMAHSVVHGELESLTVQQIIDQKILSERQLRASAGVVVSRGMQVAGHSEKEKPLSEDAIFLRNNTFYISPEAYNNWCRKLPADMVQHFVSPWSGNA